MRTVSLPALIYIGLYTALSQANPLPPNAAALIPSDFILAPLYTPPPPRASDSLTTDAHIISDS